MSNIIKLLPDNVANQIAAGEVIQRPASAAKEMLENAIDSGAEKITLIVKDAGKTLIQVTDDGKGMSEIDARMAFERHATSKISSADDLFAIKTMGFRGEALASIAAISHVELKTKAKGESIGTKIKIEGSLVVSQEPCQCNEGTSIMIKNLFFNVPARRNFLKSNNVELRHINEEFIRVALINPSKKFQYYNNDKLVFNLVPGGIKLRIAALFGNPYNERLLPVEQETDMVSISGFIGKPEFVKKTRGEQYFFVNNRFIKHAYLNHAVNNAYTELIPDDSYPSYFIKIDVDPKDIDVNIHPTKTEVNFQDARYIYAVLHASVKQAIGKYSLTPTIDFDVNPEVESAFTTAPSRHINQPQIQINPDFNPFENTSPSKGSGVSNQTFEKPSTHNWEKLYEGASQPVDPEKPVNPFENKQIDPQSDFSSTDLIQIHNKYIVCNVKNGMMIIDQSLAHYRIKYDDFLQRFKSSVKHSQQQLFPQNINLSPEDAEIVNSITDDLSKIGFMIEKAGPINFVIVGIPADLQDVNVASVIESIIENHKKNINDLNVDKHVTMARSIAIKTAMKSGTKLDKREMKEIYDSLFMCTVPKVSPDGDLIYRIISTHELENLLNV